MMQDTAIPTLTTAPSKKGGLKSLWNHRSFRQILISRVLSNFGDSVDVIAYSWLVYLLTGSKLLMGTLFAVGTLPTIVLGVFAGVWVDRWSKKRTAIVSAVIRGAIVAGTALLYISGTIEVWHLFVLSMLLSSVAAFSNPAMMSWLPQLLSKEQIMPGNSLMASAAQTARLGGFALSGALIAWVGLGGAFGLNVLMLLLSAWVLLVVPSPRSDQEKASGNLSASRFGQELLSGFSYLIHQKMLLLIIGLATFLNFAVSPIEALEAAYVGELLEQGPSALSALSIGMAVGMIIGGLILGQIGSSVRKGTLMIAGFVIMGISIGLMPLPPLIQSPQIALIFAAGLYLLLGLSINLIASPATAYVMEETPPQLLGRVASLFNTLCLAAFPIGSALSGALAEQIQLSPLYLIMCGLVLIPTVVIVMTPKLRTLK
ncbi:MFS transporter [Saccharibacillus sp. JS10]|uniref:MFS transporter n=1 Tax=Saccharibacillus sp. JS10 TaxID=2950552 RepID=UPI002109A3D9|nr:MFS transporter [Saccharibacillus sp. JS10]MCQ4085253.1 MFS transporter [Saccharibacillus sp. JS10]